MFLLKKEVNIIMKSLKDKFQEYLKKKSTFGKITDVIFILFLVALFIPNSRVAIGGFVNRVKSMIIEPSLEDSDNEQTVNFNEINWQLTDINGSTVNFQDYKGKVIFLNFWATWCPPCVGEMPGIQDLYDKFKNNSDVGFLLVSNEELSKIKTFTDKREYTFPIFSSRYKARDIFESKSIPTTFVISKEGKIKIKETGAVNWGGDKMEQIINELLNK